MVKFYVMKINDGTITIDDVQERWRAKVEEALKKERKVRFMRKMEKLEVCDQRDCRRFF